MNCQKTKSKLADLLLDENAAPLKVREHVEACVECSEELAELRSTMALLDAWETPAANPYFDARLLARLRAEQQAPPASFFERFKARFLYSSSLRMQPLMAGALGLVVLVGGGTYADLAWQAAQTQESATVLDLKSLDGNAQVFQQLDSVDQAGQDQSPGANMPSND